jgi:hypothetical protein
MKRKNLIFLVNIRKEGEPISHMLRVTREMNAIFAVLTVTEQALITWCWECLQLSAVLERYQHYL